MSLFKVTVIVTITKIVLKEMAMFVKSIFDDR